MSPNEKVVLVAAVAAVVWILLVLATRRLSRPRAVRPVPATPRLRDEPPAVVNLLVNRGAVTDDAARATLVDLAARRVLELFQPGDDPQGTLVRVNGRPTDLRPYEQRIFDRVASATGAASTSGEVREGYAPLSALEGRHAKDGAWWRGGFAREVRADATSAGLTESWFSWITVALMMSGAVVAMLVSATVMLPFVEPRTPSLEAPATTTLSGWGYAAAACTCLVAFTAMLLFVLAQQDAEGLKPAGREAAAHWLGVAAWLRAHEDFDDLPVASVTVWDRYLSYGVALGANPAAAAGIDLSVGRAEELWSKRGGSWHRVRVTYPRAFAVYGTPAGIRVSWALATLPLWLLLVWLGIRWYDQRELLAVGLVAIGVVQASRAAYRLLMGVADLLSPVTWEGTLLSIVPSTAAAETRPTSPPEDARRPWWRQRWMYAVVDTGKPRTRPWLVAESRTDRCRPGDLVVVRGQRFGRWARSISRP